MTITGIKVAAIPMPENKLHVSLFRNKKEVVT
jgi:hypothetical protein